MHMLEMLKQLEEWEFVKIILPLHTFHAKLVEVRKKKVTGWNLVPEKRLVGEKNRTPECVEVIFDKVTLTFVIEDTELVFEDGWKFIVGDTCVLLQQSQMI
jgi:hypothetical protein